MFKNPFSFRGRIRRLEYGFSLILFSVAIGVLEFISKNIGLSNSNLQELLGFTFYLPAIWFIVAQGAKRCHDRGNPGYWQIIPYYFIWMIFADSDMGPNQYGGYPKYFI